MREKPAKSTKRLIKKSLYRLILELQAKKDTKIEKERLKTSYQRKRNPTF